MQVSATERVDVPPAVVWEGAGRSISIIRAVFSGAAGAVLVVVFFDISTYRGGIGHDDERKSGDFGEVVEDVSRFGGHASG